MIYNYRNDELVQDVILEDLADLADDIIEEYVGLRRFDYLAVYAPVYIVSDLLPMLINNDVDLYVNDESEFDILEDSDNVVILSINHDGNMFVEDVNGLHRIKQSDAVLTYYYDELSQSDLKLLSEHENKSILVFGFENEFENDDENFEMYVSVDDEGVPHGFSATWVDECDEGCSCYQSYSVFSTCPTRVSELAELFGIDL